MMQSLCFTVILIVFLILCPHTYGQATLSEAGIKPRSNEHKPWPNLDAAGNGFGNFDIASTHNGFAVYLFGHDGITPCGPHVALLNYVDGVTNYYSGLSVDDEAGGTWGFPDRIGEAAKNQPPGSGGFSVEVVGDSASYMNYCVGITAKDMAVFDGLVAPETISATAYVGGDGWMHLWQHGYTDSSSVHPPFAQPGQTIPSGSITNHPARIAGTGASRTCGILALGDGGVVTVTEDMTGGDPGAAFGIPSPGKSVIVITVWGDYGNSVRTPSFMYPGVGGDAPARQSVSGGNPFIVVRTAMNTAKVFTVDGNVILDYGDYIDGSPMPSGIISLETGGMERSISAIGGARTAIAVRGLDTEGKYHPCAVVLDATYTESGYRAIKHVLQVDDDLFDDSNFTDGSAMDVAVGPNLDILVAWRKFPSQSPVARFYDRNLKPISPTFWVSTKEAADVNTGDTTIKCSLKDEFGWVAWLSESFNPGLNCKGNQMQRDTVVRAFQNPTWVSAVKDWEGY